MRRTITGLVFAFLLLGPAAARALVTDYETGKKKAAATVEKKVAWRNSTITYENIFSALALDPSADLTYNPYYAQSFSFRPRYYLRDDLSLRARLDFEVEITKSDETDTLNEVIFSDLILEGNYSPEIFKIPVLDIQVSPSVRLLFPTSIVNRNRSLVLGLAPGLTFLRSFDLLKGRWLKSVNLLYGFRATKYFHEYAVAPIESGILGCENSSRPECQHSGFRNKSWRLTNTFEMLVQITDKLAFTADLMVVSDLLHGLSARDVQILSDTDNGTTVHFDESKVDYHGALWGIFDLSYDVLDWLTLSLGVSTYHPMLLPDSSGYYPPYFNRYTNFYFDVTIPVDKFVSQVQDWTGWGKGGAVAEEE